MRYASNVLMGRTAGSYLLETFSSFENQLLSVYFTR